MLCHLFALAFLLPDKILTIFDILKTKILSIANNIVQWFENNYIYGRI